MYSSQAGLDVMLLSNDDGGQISVHSGIVSGMDWNVPQYGPGKTDMNTFYGGVRLGAKGGSSGSPVVTRNNGAVIGLVTGGRPGTFSCDFLPLDKPLRALGCIRDGKPISRGDIHCQFLLFSFADCRERGLDQGTELLTRKSCPGCSGMLVASFVVPRGFSDGKILEGDIVLSINGNHVTDFIQLGDVLDSNVGKDLTLRLRRGHSTIDVRVDVDDIDRITPKRFVTVAGATFQDVSYPLARGFGVPVAGVHVSSALGSFEFGNFLNGWILDTLNNEEVPTLDGFMKVMRRIPDQSSVLATYWSLRDKKKLRTSIIVDRRWGREMKLAVRNDGTGLWDFRTIGPNLHSLPSVRQSASAVGLPHFPGLVESFVYVACNLPCLLDGFPRKRTKGVGLVIDADQGYVLVSRPVVPHSLGGITVVIANSIIIPASIVFMHPLHGYVIVKYDPSLVGAYVHTAVLAAEPLRRGDEPMFFGFTPAGAIRFQPTTVIDSELLTVSIQPEAPRTRVANATAVLLDSSLAPTCNSGVLLDPDGTVRALWLSLFGDSGDGFEDFALDASVIRPIVSAVRENRTTALRMPPILLAQEGALMSRQLGISENWAKKMNEEGRTQFYVVSGTMPHEGGHNGLLEGDLILTIDGKLCSRASHLDLTFKRSLSAHVVRDGKEIDVRVETYPLQDLETSRAISFCGALLQRPHLSARQQLSELPSEVYVSCAEPGSPAQQQKLTATTFITHVNNNPIHDLDSFIAATSSISNDTSTHIAWPLAQPLLTVLAGILLRTMTLGGRRGAISIRKNDHYYPAQEWSRNHSGEWRHRWGLGKLHRRRRHRAKR